MSSRNFRRRNNRRRHKQGDQQAAPGGEPRAPGQPAPEGDGRGQDRGTPRDAGDAPGGGARPGAQPSSSAPSGRGRRRFPARRERERRGGDNRADRQQPEKAREPSTPRICPDCPVCGKPVRELPSALTHRPTGSPAHFECILKELRDANELAPQEKLCYLGGGAFGILQFRQAGGTTRFTIRKRIPYEEKDTPQEWKKSLAVTC